jgi:hypothetical protein
VGNDQLVPRFSLIQDVLSAAMPSNSKKTKKVRCCTVCGRRAKGHLGVTGNKCRMDAILEERSKVKDSVESSDEGSSRDVTPLDSPVRSVKSEDGNSARAIPVEAKVDRLESKFDTLTEVLMKLVARVSLSTTSKGVPVSDGVDKSKKVAQAKAVAESSSVSEGASGGVDVKLPITQSLARDKELNKLLELYTADSQRVLTALESIKSAASQGEIPKVKKHLSIPDNLSRLSGVPRFWRTNC